MADQPTEAQLALYRKLSTEHLQTLLRSDLDGPPLDEATVDSILTVGLRPTRPPHGRISPPIIPPRTPPAPRSDAPARTCRRPTPASASRSAWCPPPRPCLS